MDTLRLLGRDFKIVRMTGKEITNEVDSFQRLNGYIEPNSSIIYVANDIEIQAQHSTIIHEVLHGLFPDIAEEWIEEAEIKVYSFIRDNPEFITDILNGCEESK